ncbi:hypothetical protein [Kordia zhangzhouensis]|uniref:hypothetical protein n=1 Tax=Kordia zhangzhouensis TaxID=1620405 RepID=UPI00138E3149|nr:hypothetical protein [Kordia zhangzhouensis]
MLIVIFILAVMVAFIIKKSSQHKSQEFIENERQQMRDSLLKKRKKLSPHTADLYKKVTDAMIFETEDAVTYLKTSGFIYSEQQKPLIAFERIERGMYEKGHIIAFTKKQEFLFEFHGSEVIFYVDGELLGRLDKKGQLADSHEQIIGKATHPLHTTFGINFYKRSHTRTNEGLFPLIMNGRKLASISVAPNYGEIGQRITVSDVFDTLEFGTPIISLLDTPNAIEEKWLLAFAIFETVFHGKKLIP